MGEFNLFCFYCEVLCFMCRVKSVSCIWWWVLVFLLWYKSCGNFYAVLFFLLIRSIFSPVGSSSLCWVFFMLQSLGYLMLVASLFLFGVFCVLLCLMCSVMGTSFFVWWLCELKEKICIFSKRIFRREFYVIFL